MLDRALDTLHCKTCAPRASVRFASAIDSVLADAIDHTLPLRTPMSVRTCDNAEAHERSGEGMRFDRPVEFLSGAAFSAFGISFACGASVFNAAPAIPGAGVYLPLLSGLLVALTGNLVILRSLSLGRLYVGPFKSTGRALLWILLGNLVFAAALGAWAATGLPTLGLFGGIYVACFAVWLAGRDVRPRIFAGLAAALVFGSYLALVVALGLELPVWPTFAHL
ncbi:MAG: hypothetical protein BGP22_00655 [Variovorax sp. 67-131]|nr:MAG: hypothetical protein BGP22_00655 [Variovorax sp. 67-131]